VELNVTAELFKAVEHNDDVLYFSVARAIAHARTLWLAFFDELSRLLIGLLRKRSEICAAAVARVIRRQS
jgi:hypothetical protein